MKSKNRRKKQAKNKRDRPKKKRRKCGVIPESKACNKQARNRGMYCQGCEHNKFR